jgi:hypothetical protein
MRNRALQFLLVSISFACLLIACKSSKPDVVMIVEEGGGGAVFGKVTFELGPSGNLEPKIWVPGYVVIFRNEGKLGNEPGQPGHAYKITRDFKLEHIAKVDLKKSNEELAKQFGVKVKSQN